MSDRRSHLRKPSAFTAAAPLVAAPWVWEGYLAPGAVTILSAGFKVGKSTLLTLLLDALRAGGTLAGAAVAKGRAILLSEEPERAWRPRWAKFDLEGHAEFDLRPFPEPPTHDDWAAFARSLAATPAELVVFDSLLHFQPPHAEASLPLFRRWLAPVRELADAGRACLVMHQPAKGRSGDFNFRGCGGVDGDPEVLLEMKLPYGATPDDRRRVLQARSRLDLVPPRRVLELDAAGRALAVVSEPPDGDSFEAGWAGLKCVLEDATERLTCEQVAKEWPPDHGMPSRATLHRWLARAVELKRAARTGQGRRSKPFRYFLPGRTFDPFATRIPDFGEMDRDRYG